MRLALMSHKARVLSSPCRSATAARTIRSGVVMTYLAPPGLKATRLFRIGP